jgi:hypothetical protein
VITTLKKLYQNYLKENPASTLTYDEWLDQVWQPYISDDFQIGPDGAFEDTDDISDWDNTLMDGLEDE